ncbi:MAG: hypothetical protein ACXADB_09680 [Candidatus Hermodarchaeia archaeon]|jgi:hypothetical protein
MTELTAMILGSTAKPKKQTAGTVLAFQATSVTGTVLKVLISR